MKWGATVVLGSITTMLLSCAGTSPGGTAGVPPPESPRTAAAQPALPPPDATSPEPPASQSTPAQRASAPTPAPTPEHARVTPATEPGSVDFDITDVVGRRLPARVEVRDARDRLVDVVPVPNGRKIQAIPSGDWRAFVYVYDNEVPVLVDVQPLGVKPGLPSSLEVRLLEGSGTRSLREFDRDFDLAIDRVELQLGTDPDDAASIPGIESYTWPSPVLSTRAQWYRGELHAHSNYGIGSESVAQLVRRAERGGLDFLAITDRNTLAAAFDPAFTSRSVVLIPAMEWGNEDRGVGLVYAPRTFPTITQAIPEAQANLLRIQSQGGLFFIAHPCFSTAPWQWGLSYVNGVEAWCRPWRAVPPLWLERLSGDMTVRKDGRLIHSIALAAASDGYSANGQATWFYDHELNRGLRAAVIGGSYSVGPQTPLGEPLTYVFANEKSLKGILDGMRWGRTYVSRGVNGPKLAFTADVLIDGTENTGIGGWVPLHVPSRFSITVEDAQGLTLQVLLNGSVFISRKIDNIERSGNFTFQFDFVPESYSVFRVRIIGPPRDEGFGFSDVHAMTSPIYALEVIPEIQGAEGSIWLQIENQYYDPGAADRFLPSSPEGVRTITPRWTF